MALRNQPYIPLYVQDYLTDEKLNACSPASQGVYIKVICVLHKSEPYGTILLKQKDKQNASNILNFASKFAKLLPFTHSDIESALTELIEEGVMTLDDDTLYQKRMVRDNELSEKRACAGSKGGQARLKEGVLLKQKGKQNPSKQSSKSEANSEYENEYDNETDNVSKKVKHKYGSYENVLLSDEDFQKLINEFPRDYQKRIEQLSEGIASKGYKYKNHLATIRSWARREKEKPSGNPFKDKLQEAIQNEQNGSNSGHVGYQGGLSKLLQEPNGD